MHTIYINGINEKIAQNKLKRVLFKLCSRYGTVVQVTAHGNLKMKGQAFVAFDNEKSSEKAIQKLNAYPLFKKPITVTSASKESDQILLNNGQDEKVQQRKEAKAQRQEKHPSTSLANTNKISKAQVAYWKSLPIHNVLLIQNLPQDVASHPQFQQNLQNHFSSFEGFDSVRAIKARRLAFIHFESDSQASSCLQKFDPAVLGNDILLTYAKK